MSWWNPRRSGTNQAGIRGHRFGDGAVGLSARYDLASAYLHTGVAEDDHERFPHRPASSRETATARARSSAEGQTACAAPAHQQRAARTYAHPADRCRLSGAAAASRDLSGLSDKRDAGRTRSPDKLFGRSGSSASTASTRGRETTPASGRSGAGSKDHFPIQSGLPESGATGGAFKGTLFCMQLSIRMA